MSEPKYMDIREFREFGYLQEVNRRFFHPLGLALSIRMDTETSEAELEAILDVRDDPEGVAFAELGLEEREKANRVTRAWGERAAVRLRRLGYVIQPIEGIVEVDGEEDDDLVQYAHPRDALVNFTCMPAEEAIKRLVLTFPAHALAEVAYSFEGACREQEPRLLKRDEAAAILRPYDIHRDWSWEERRADLEARAQAGPWFEVLDRLPPRWRDEFPWSIYVLLQMANAFEVMVARWNYETEEWTDSKGPLPSDLVPWLWTYLPQLPDGQRGYAFRPAEAEGQDE